MAKRICETFGTTPRAQVMSVKDVRNIVRGVEVPYADSQTGRLNLIKYIDDITLAIHQCLKEGK